MSATLLTDAALAARLEADAAQHLTEYVQLLEGLRRGVGAFVQLRSGGVAVRTLDALGINVAIGLGMRGSVPAEDLDDLEALYLDANLPAMLELCPFADRSLLVGLGDRQYRIVNFTNVLVRELDDETAPAPPGIDVQPVTERELEVWVAAMTRAMATRTNPGLLEADTLMARIAFARPGSLCFLARLEDRVVGTGALVVRADEDGWRLGTLYMANTLPEARGRGVQQALIGARLEAARALGCDAVAVQARPGNQSHHHLERLGFRVVYTKSLLERRWR